MLALVLCWRVAYAGGDITDLPFLDVQGGTPGNGAGRRVNCSWHTNCFQADLGRRPHLAIDFRARPEGRWGLHAPGHGVVAVAKDMGSPQGLTVEIKHPDGQVSVLYHLKTVFVSEGMKVCRFVALGRVGKSGLEDYPGAESHIHFGTKGDEEGDRFTPIRGAGGHQYQEGDFTEGAIIHHDCGGRCSSKTYAYTVDDTQNPANCASCSVEEFKLFGSLWQKKFSKGGFAYRDFQEAVSWYRCMVRRPESPLNTAQFRPMLRVIDPEWSIYAFVPILNDDSDTHKREMSPAVEYKVKWYDFSGNPYQQTFIINQRDNAGKWVRIGETYPTYWTPYDPSGWIPQEERPFPLVLEVTNEEKCVQAGLGAPCYGKWVAADAALFVPKNCGP